MAGKAYDRECMKSSSSDSGLDHDHLFISLSFLLSLEKPEKLPRYYETLRDGQHKRIYSTLPRTNQFHISYQLFPTLQEYQTPRTYKTDMVVFGNVVSKIYTESDTRVIQGFPDDDEEEEEEGESERGEREGEGKQQPQQPDMYKYCWRHKHKIKVNKALLLAMHSHVLEVRLWTAPNKLSTRAHYDKPKAFRLPSVSTTSVEENPGMDLVKRPSRFPDVSHDHQIRNSRGRSTRGKQQQWGVPMEISLQSVQSIDNYVNPETDERSKDELLAECKAQTEHISPPQNKLRSHTPSPHPLTRTNFGTYHHRSLSLEEDDKTRQAKEREEAERARIDKEGLVVLRIKFSDLFSKQGKARGRMNTPVDDLKRFEVFVNTGKSLPAHILRELKPIAITVERVTNLPNKPLSHEELSNRCEPVFVQYQFPTTPPHTTSMLPHARSLTFNSSNVLLLGTISPNVLLEHLRGPPLVFELHDRVGKSQLTPSCEAIFGSESQDRLINNPFFSFNLASSAQAKNLYPYGIATFDLSLLLSGQLSMEFTLPVIRGPRSQMEVVDRKGAYHILPGNYLDSGCEISVKVELSYPLAFLNVPATLPLSTEKTPKHTSKWKRTVRKSIPFSETNPLLPPPFNRLVYVVTSEGGALIERLVKMVNEINAKTLNLDNLSPKVMRAALSTYKLSQEQVSSRECDIITGFHIEDSDQHIVVLEGLKDGGIQSLWDELPHHPSQDPTLRKVLYNSEFGFMQRLYSMLDVDLPKIRLFRPLKEIIQIPMIYLRGENRKDRKDYIPPESFRCLMCLNEMSELVNKMADLTRSNIFPSAEEVAALSLQFGLPAYMEHRSPAPPARDLTPQRPMTPHLTPRRKRERILLDHSNREYEAMLRERAKSKDGGVAGKDFIQSNKAHCEAMSEFTRLHHPARHTHYRSYSEDTSLPVYNYSCQARNSTQHTLARLREELQPNRRYTFCQEFLSAGLEFAEAPKPELAKRKPTGLMFELVGDFDLSADDLQFTERKFEAKASPARVQTVQMKERFTYPGVRSARECNVHPKKPDSARIKEFSEPYKEPEKKLGISRLRSTFDRFALEGKPNFDLLKPPPPDMFGSLQRTVHPVGDEWEEEQEEAKRKEKREWREKIVVDDIHFHTHRRTTNTELRGKAADRLDALQGMLKDPPKKLSLQQECEVPALGVIQQSSVGHTQVLSVGGLLGKEEGEGERCWGYLPGPAFGERSLRHSTTFIPREKDPPSKPFRLYYQANKSLCHYPNKPRPSEVPGSRSPPVPLVFINDPTQQQQAAQATQHQQQAPA